MYAIPNVSEGIYENPESEEDTMTYVQPKLVQIYEASTTINSAQAKIPGNPDGLVDDPHVTGPTYDSDED